MKLQQMSSNNIDQNSMLRYISFCLQIWGISYINKDILKKCRDNSPQTSHILTCLLFHLSVLQILDFQYTVDALQITVDQHQIMEEFVLAYLSQTNCPLLLRQCESQQYHTLDFSQSRVLLIAAGWLMAKTDFFDKIRTKLIPKLFSTLYLQKHPKQVHKVMGIKKAESVSTRYAYADPSIQTIEQMYKQLNQHLFKIDCLQRKKSKINNKLNKQINLYNKIHQTNIKIQNILYKQQNNQEKQSIEDQQLEMIVTQCIKGVKKQQYFWVWLQQKIIQPQFKDLQTKFGEQFQKMEPQITHQWSKLNPQYLLMYDKQYRSICKKKDQINQYMTKMKELFAIRQPKDAQNIRKQIQFEAKKLLNEQNNEMLQSLGMPCFLKLQIGKYFQSKGFGCKKKKEKNKKDEKPKINNCQTQQQQLKIKISQFIQSLDQILFL